MRPYIIPNDDRDFTDTLMFQEMKQKWIDNGMSKEDIKAWTDLHHSFDVWGNDKGCDYSNTDLAYDTSKLGYEHCIR